MTFWGAEPVPTVWRPRIYAEAAQHVLKSGHALLDVVLAVHAELGGAAAGGDGDGLVGAGLDQGGSLNTRVSGAGAEAAAVGAGGGDETCDLSRSLGKVAAAALVHIAAGLLAAVDDVLDVGFLQARVVHAGEQSQDGGRLGDDVFVHDVSGEVHVDIVGALDAADQNAVVVQALGVLLLDQALDLTELNALLDAGHDALVDHGVGGELILVGGDKVLVQPHQIEHVACLHQEQELLLGHHLAEVAVTLGHVAGGLIEGLGNGGQLSRGLVADVDLVGPVSQDVFPAAQVVGQFLEVVAVGIDNHLSGLGGAVVQNHIGDMAENVASAFDNTLHKSSLPLI